MGTPAGLSPDETTIHRVPSQTDRIDMSGSLMNQQATTSGGESSSNFGQPHTANDVTPISTNETETQIRPAFSASRIFNKMQKEVQL